MSLYFFNSIRIITYITSPTSPDHRQTLVLIGFKTGLIVGLVKKKQVPQRKNKSHFHPSKIQ